MAKQDFFSYEKNQANRGAEQFVRELNEHTNVRLSETNYSTIGNKIENNTLLSKKYSDIYRRINEFKNKTKSNINKKISAEDAKKIKKIDEALEEMNASIALGKSSNINISELDEAIRMYLEGNNPTGIDAYNKALAHINKNGGLSKIDEIMNKANESDALLAFNKTDLKKCLIEVK